MNLYSVKMVEDLINYEIAINGKEIKESKNCEELLDLEYEIVESVLNKMTSNIRDQLSEEFDITEKVSDFIGQS